MDSLFRIKICGITRPADATAVADAGGDAIGINFYTKSVRYVGDSTALTIATACPAGVQKVGLFVNSPTNDIVRRVKLLSLDWVQLHGDESPEMIDQLGNIPTIRAFRCRDHDLRPIVDYLRKCRSVGRQPRAVLLDAWHADHYGGTGKTLDWDRLLAEIDRLPDIPWILAGGLRADNVMAAIRQLHPDAVDTASGVESAPGIKDPTEIINFIRSAKSADAWR